MGKRSYTTRTSLDGATEHVAKGAASPTAREKQEIAQRLLEKVQDETLFESRDGACRIKQLPPPLGKFCTSFSECAACSVSRLGGYYFKGDTSNAAEPRQRFRRTVVERELGRVPSPPTVRAVSIGCGGLLTDFECLLELWSRGCTIESFVAIDTAYSGHGQSVRDQQGYMESLAALARFFAPTCRVFSFTSSDDYIAAAALRPELYGRATMFLHCDSGEVADVHYKDAAATALLPGCCSYELWNVGGGLGAPKRPPLLTHLPQRLHSDLEAIYRRTRYTLGVLRRLATQERADGASAGGADSAPLVLQAGLGASVLEAVFDPSLASTEQVQAKRLTAEAVGWLESTARERAAKHGQRIFEVVHDAGARMVLMRDAPSHHAKIAGARATGDEVIADEVRPDGWVRVCRMLDTREGFELWHHEREEQRKWMRLRDDDGGELMREVALDGDAEEAAAHGWRSGSLPRVDLAAKSEARAGDAGEEPRCETCDCTAGVAHELS
jgi:hypothetical protein